MADEGSTADDDIGENGGCDEASGHRLDETRAEEIAGETINHEVGARVQAEEEEVRITPMLEDGCTLSMRVEHFMANTVKHVRRRPYFGAKTIHDKHGSISFNLSEFLKLAHKTRKGYRNTIKHSGSDLNGHGSPVGEGNVDDFVPNSAHMETVDEMGIDLVNVDLVSNDVVKGDADGKKKTCVEVVKGDLANNDEINIEFVSNSAPVVTVNELGIDLVNVDLGTYDVVKVNVDMDTDDVNMDGAKEMLVDTVNVVHRGGLGVGTTLETNSASIGLFIGNIPLQTCSEPVVDDKIADAFNNSSYKTLLVVPPTIQKGEIVVRPMMESIRNGASRWETTVVGYFLRKQSYFYYVQEFALSALPGLREVKATSNGFYIF
ncbi:UNVERIFIED_CONTAM: hypothetical protein Sindi_0496500 [Sesamum indicum]